MQQLKRGQRLLGLVILYLICTVTSTQAQGIQTRMVSVNVTRMPLSDVLKSVSQQGQFVFSYNSNIIDNDSLVTVSATHKTVKQVLDLLFGTSLVYKESGNYLILQHPPSGPSYTVSGFVVDKLTGKKLSNVSVYEKEQLISTLTNDQGYFRLRLKVKDKFPQATINISKELYLDTAIITSPATVQDFTVPIRAAPMITLKPVDVTEPVEKTWVARFFLSSRQRMQSVNLKFLMDKPYQYSIVPGLSTHGKLSSQVVNRFSLNLVGGYSAGLNGLEIANIFNIDKNDVRSVQLAGMFNAVGGRVTGLQVAGIYNQVYDTVRGVQISAAVNVVKDEVTGVQLSGIMSLVQGHFNGVQLSGVGNFDRKSFTGMQASGIINLASRYSSGVQIAGILNIVKDSTQGVQIAGIGNETRTAMEGLQIGTFFNYARKMRGVQIALVNVADTSTGISIGLVNYIKKGYHKLSVYTSESLPLNIAYRSGTRKFYAVVMVGAQASSHTVLSTGFGFGHVMNLTPKLDLTPQITVQTFYFGNASKSATVYRFEPSLEWQPFKKFGVFAGPAFSLYQNPDNISVPGFKTFPLASSFRIGDHLNGWFGFHAGINIF